MSQLPPPGWHPDPFGRAQHRYWDGVRWTEHVGAGGRQWVEGSAEAPPPTPPQVGPGNQFPMPQGHQPRPAAPSTVDKAAAKVQKQVRGLGLAATSGPADLAIHSEPILVINQKGKLVELRAEYAIYDRHGTQLAAVRGKRLSSRMQVVDMTGRSLLELRRQSTLLSSKIVVNDESGTKVGRIVPSLNPNQRDRAFKLEDGSDKKVGAVFQEDSGRHRDFNVQDTQGSVVARITKTRSGLAKELFTKGDDYVLEFPGHLTGALRLLSIASALVVDASFHQR